MADPHGAIGRRPANRSFAPAEHGTRHAAQRGFRPGIEQVAGLAEQAVGDTREAVGGIELGQHEGAAVRLPIDVTIALLHQFMRFARHALRLEITGRDTLYRL